MGRMSDNKIIALILLLPVAVTMSSRVAERMTFWASLS